MSDEMTCAYCGKRKTWDAEHFPIRMYAECWDCYRANHPPKVPWTAKLHRFFDFLATGGGSMLRKRESVREAGK